MSRNHPLQPRMRAVTVAVSVLLAASGCGGGEGPSNDAAGGAGTPAFENHTAATEVEVLTTDNLFQPAFVEVRPGTTLTFVNRGRATHNVRPDTAGSFEGIESTDLEAGESASITFDTPGEFGFHCSLHGAPGRVQFGRVRVVEAG